MNGLLWLPESLFPEKKGKYYATYPTFEMVFGDAVSNTFDDLIKELSQFDGLDLLEYLAKVNLILADGFFWRDDREYPLLIQDLFEPEIAKRIEGFRQQQGRFTTPLHFWALIKAALLYCNFENGNSYKTVRDNRNKVGIFFLRIASHLGKDYIDRKSPSLDDEKRRRLLLLTIMRSQEVVRSRRWNNLLARYQMLYREYVPRIRPKESYHFDEKFSQITGFSLNDFMTLGFLLYTHYAKPKAFLGIGGKKKSFVFKHFFSMGPKGEFQQKLYRMYPLISSDLTSYRKAFDTSRINQMSFWYDFNPVWQKPLYRVSEIEVFPLDIGYLFEKFTLGTYWTVKDHLLMNEKDAENQQFNTFFGKVIEMYCDDIFQRIFNLSQIFSKRYWSELKGEINGVDGIAYCPGTLFFFEFTTREIRRNVFLNQSWDDFESEKCKILFGESGEERGRSKAKGKIIQLDKAISDFKSRKLASVGVSPDEVKMIIPVIVFQKSPPFAKEYWEETYLNSVLQKVENKNDFANLQFLDLEELEVIEALVQSGNSFEQLFQKKFLGEHKFNSFKVFGINELKDWPPNTELSKKLRVFAGGAKQIFK